ncbi:hypothetical protein QBC39DRAFT_360672 [Podospora conica]|nr:hypothetical protein QBC39DRAFT_360672 [Schizothecium conicum]
MPHHAPPASCQPPSTLPARQTHVQYMTSETYAVFPCIWTIAPKLCGRRLSSGAVTTTMMMSRTKPQCIQVRQLAWLMQQQHPALGFDPNVTLPPHRILVVDDGAERRSTKQRVREIVATRHQLPDDLPPPSPSHRADDKTTPNQTPPPPSSSPAKPQHLPRAGGGVHPALSGPGCYVPFPSLRLVLDGIDREFSLSGKIHPHPGRSACTVGCFPFFPLAARLACMRRDRKPNIYLDLFLPEADREHIETGRHYT